MATKWNDILLRKALDDDGTYPYAGGNWTNSPDIIPTGTNVFANPADVFGAKSYGQDLGQPTVFEQPNYFYARGKNLSPNPVDGQLYMYYCPQNLFLFPSLWSKNQMSTSSGQKFVGLSAADTNAVAVTGEPFTYTPTSNIHSCLISRVVTPAHPNPLPADGTFTTMDDLAKYICNSPNMAWRNVVLVDKGVPTFTNTFQIDTSSLAPGSQSTCLIGISYTNLTVGSQLAFSAGTPIPSGPDQGKVIQLTQTGVPQSNGSLGTSYLTIPAGYKTNVSFSYWATPPVQANWTVQFYAILITNPDMDLHAHSKPVHELGIGLDAGHPLLQLNSNGITRGIRIGDVSVIGK
jgi:hypothetical protein